MVEAGGIAVLGLAGGILAVDRTAGIQSMVSRPLVGATIVGWAFGHPSLGLLSGLLVELLWLMDLPVGCFVPPDETLTGVLAAAYAIWSPEAWSHEARAAMGILLAIPFGVGGRWLDIAVRQWNGRLLAEFRRRLREGDHGGVARAHLLGGARFFGAGAVTAALGGAMGWGLLTVGVPLLPEGTVAVLELVEATIPLIGAAAVLAALPGGRHAAVFAGGLLLGGWAAKGVGPLWQSRGR